MRKPMPYVPGAIRAWLLDQPDFVALLHGGAVSTREVPDPLTLPHVSVAVVDHGGNSPMLRKMAVQVTPYAPTSDISGLDEDPDVTVWNLAATAGELLGGAKNQIIDGRHAWSADWYEGPIQMYDTERGIDRPIFYAPVRCDVTLRRR